MSDTNERSQRPLSLAEWAVLETAYVSEGQTTEFPVKGKGKERVPPSAPNTSAPNRNDEVMGFEEVSLRTPAPRTVNAEGGKATPFSSTDDDEEEDDLALPELTRKDSFDFVAQRARENEADAEVTQLMQQSLRESTPPPPPPPEAAHIRRPTLSTTERLSRPHHYIEDVEMQRISPDPVGRLAREVRDDGMDRGLERGGWSERVLTWFR